MFVLVEASEQSDVRKAQELWDLLASVYAANADLFELAEDRRKLHAAELIVAAWHAYRSKHGSLQLEDPTFVTQLGQKLSDYDADLAPQISQSGPRDGDQQGIPNTGLTPEADFDFDFDMDFQDIDWSFWSSME
jgi:hypothetical protein